MQAIKLSPEELANSATHGLGAVLSALGLVALVGLANSSGDGWQMLSSVVFGTSMVVLYTSSALYHSAQNKRLRRLFLRCDYAGIFLLIAGTYTPFLLVQVRGTLGWGLLAAVWGLCLTGIVLVSLTKFPLKSCAANTLFYLALGWLFLGVLKPLFAVLPSSSFMLLCVGGVCYTVGTVFLHYRPFRFNHAIWHTFVLAGSACHWVAVYTSLGGGSS